MKDILGKAPGDVDYPTGKVKNLKKMPDGNPYPYEQMEDVRDGVFGEERASKGSGDPSYSPKAESQTGDDGNG